MKHRSLLLFMLLSLSFLFLSLLETAFGGGVFRIHSVSELIQFSNDVNNGTSYNGTTVYLDSDIDFSEEFSQQFDPIGNNSNDVFRGSFDGQGHVVSNLKMSSRSDYSGLFGCADGAIIRNIVIDGSCSFTSAYGLSELLYIGGIIGCCGATNDKCDIENSVNMASVSSGNYSANLGGIAGTVYSALYYDSSITNCVNYGSVTHLWNNTKTPCVGGIAGAVTMFYSSMRITNCFNYGTVTYNGESGSLHIGGIIGESYNGFIENCVSVGDVISVSPSSIIGSIVGSVFSTTSAVHSFWTSNVDHNASGSNGLTVDDETNETDLDLAFVEKLNVYSSNNGWNKWLLNTDGARVSFKINNGKGFVIDSQIVLLPDILDNNERTFSGWYKDEMLNSLFADSVVDSDTTLYGMFCGTNYTVTLDMNCGDASSLPSLHPMIIECNGIYGILPRNVTRFEHTFNGWFTERDGGTKVESGDAVNTPINHTLYAQWTINQYTVTFVFNNGEANEIKTFDFNATIEYPKGAQKEGYTFNGWDRIVAAMPAGNITITAQWVEKSTEFVEIVFNKKDLTKEEAKTIISQYTNEEFTIEGFEVDSKTGEIKVIVKFADTAKAVDFVRSVNENNRPNSTFLKRVSSVDRDTSFTLALSPVLFVNFIFL